MLVAISRLAFSFCHRRRSAPMRVPFAAGVGSVRRRCEFRSVPMRVPFGARHRRCAFIRYFLSWRTLSRNKMIFRINN